MTYLIVETYVQPTRYDLSNTPSLPLSLTEEPLDHLTSSCALCPSESKILHPNAVQLGCGKEGQEKEFFRKRRVWNGHTKELFSKSNMLQTPFLIGGNGPRYRLDWPSFMYFFSSHHLSHVCLIYCIIQENKPCKSNSSRSPKNRGGTKVEYKFWPHLAEHLNIKEYNFVFSNLCNPSRPCNACGLWL